VETFWERFSAATGVTADYDAWSFGDEDSPDLADELAWLVLHGPKRATTCLYEDAVADGDMPTRGAYSVVLDGSGGPVCVIRTTEVDIRPFGEVDDAYAWDEGEGDRSLAFWRQAHIDFFAQNGHSIEDDTLVVLERFDLLWPRPGEEGWRRYRPADDPVSQLLAGYASARSNGDVDALVAAHAPGGFAVRAGEVVRHDSAESLTAYYRRIVAAERSADEHVWTLEDLAFEYPADRAGLAVAQWTVRSEDGTAMRTVDTTYVVTMDDDRWRIMGEIEHD
jgi:uncharacterized protein YhfF